MSRWRQNLSTEFGFYNACWRNCAVFVAHLISVTCGLSLTMCCHLWCSSGVSCHHKHGKSCWGSTNKLSLSKLVRICTALDAMDYCSKVMCRLSCTESLCSRRERVGSFLATGKEPWKTKMMVIWEGLQLAKMKSKIHQFTLGVVWPQLEMGLWPFWTAICIQSP